MCDDIRKFIVNADIRNRQKLKKKLEEENEAIISEIARAFWEDEGSISVKGNLIGEIKNEPLRDQLIRIHKKLGIKVTPYIDHTYNCHGIYVKREGANLAIFCEKVGFRHGIITAGRLAGCRKIDAFKKHYEGNGGLAGI